MGAPLAFKTANLSPSTFPASDHVGKRAFVADDPDHVVINLDTRDHRPQTGFTRWQVTITESPTKKVTEGFDTHGRQLSRTGGSGFDAFKRSQDDCAPVVEGGDAILEAGIECNDPILDRTISSVLYNPEMKLSH